MLGGGNATCKTNVDALGSFAVRFGGTIDRAMLYVKGGLAWAYERHKVSSPGSTFDGFGAYSVEQKHWRWGGMLGAGVEFAFTNTISGKLEYNYMDFGTRTYSFVIDPGPPFGAETVDVKIRQNIHLVKVSLNFRWDSPVVARY
jgi:outer membrane immunogenic protein